ncbi:MAG: AMP-binding protein [Ignavibacteria bacterium]|jgi:O-succinylbenzoic acid--CoA ligase
MINTQLKSDWLKTQSELYPDNKFIYYDGKSYSYREIESLVSVAASKFFNDGIKKNEYVFLTVKNNFNFIISLFALWKLNAIPVIVSAGFKADELTKKIALLKKSRTVNDNDLIIKNNRSYSGDSEYSGTAIIIFTSGSTGIPKAVELTFENLYYSAVNSDSILKQTLGDKWLASLPFHHIGGFSVIIRAVLSGSSIIIPGEFTTSKIVENIKYKPTLFSVVPTMLKRIVDFNVNCYLELKYILLGGAKCDLQLINKAMAQNYPLLKVYGSTETSSFVAANDLTDFNSNIESAGKPTGDNIIEIDCRENESTGEVIVSGKSVAKRYLNNDPALKNKLINGIFRTGDIGYHGENNNLYILSRKDDMIITGGINVYPAEIEKELLKINYVSEAAVFSTESTEWGEQVNAAVVLKKRIPGEEIKTILKEKIVGYKVPKKIYVVNEFPKTSLGKIDKNKLKDITKKGDNLDSYR